MDWTKLDEEDVSRSESQAHNRGRNIGCGIAYTTFIHIWNTRFDHVSIPKHSRFTKCNE